MLANRLRKQQFYHCKKTDNTLWAWGRNEAGGIGDGTTTDKNYPVKVGNDSDWQTVSSSGTHTLAIKQNGTLWGWGSAFYGQLGDGSFVDKHIPVQIGIDSDWQQISCDGGSTMALKTNGTLWSCGDNTYGQLGDGTNTNRSLLTQIGTDTDWAFVSISFDQSIALKVNGTIWSWGRNNYGQLGDGTNISRNVPIQIGNQNDWQYVTTGGGFYLAIKANGTLWAWGRNFQGQLGDGTTINRNFPVQIGSGSDWQYVSAGAFHTLALKANGTLWAWGDNNYYGQLGGGYPNDQYSSIQIGTQTNWRSISAGGVHTAVINNSDSLMVCGWNQRGELGNGTNTGNGPGGDSEWGLNPVSCIPLAKAIFNKQEIFTLFPNPTNSFVNIQNPNNSAIDKVTVIDLTGKVVFSTINCNGKINIQNLQSGIYVLQIEFDRKIYYQKLIKQ